jgi:hypothetical protein
VAEDASGVEDGAILERLVAVVSKVEVAVCPTACLGLIEVTGVTMDVKLHLAGFEFEHGVGMCGSS